MGTAGMTFPRWDPGPLLATRRFHMIRLSKAQQRLVSGTSSFEIRLYLTITLIWELCKGVSFPGHYAPSMHAVRKSSNSTLFVHDTLPVHLVVVVTCRVRRAASATLGSCL